MRAVVAGAVSVSLAATLPATAAAQTLQGRVVSEEGGAPVGTALVRVLDAADTARAFAVADSLGRYRVELPGAGTYSIEAERIGFRPYRTPELEVPRAGGTYAVDLVLAPVAIELEGIEVEVTAERRERIERRIRLAIGGSVSALRTEPYLRPTLLDHATRGRDLADMMRYETPAGLIVRNTPDGPCFSIRGRCVAVFLDEVRMQPFVVEGIPLDMIEAAVVIRTNESLVFPNGAILLYTSGWFR